MVLDAGCKSQWVPMSLMGLGIVQQIMEARLAEGKPLQQKFSNFTISAAASPHSFLQRLESAAGYSHLCSSGKMASRHAVQGIMQARLAEGRELVRAADIPRFHGHDGTMMWSQFAS